MLHGSENKTDILIIGGGVIGVCSAYYLAKRGRKVTLIEKEEIGAGSSYGNAGLIVPSDLVPLAAPGVLTQGLKWMLDAESPFYIKPRFDRELINWLWRFRAACKMGPMQKAVPVLRGLGRASAELYEILIAEEELECEYQQAGGLTIFRTQQGLEKGQAELHLLEEHDIPVTVLDGDGVRKLEPAVNASVLGGILLPEDAHLDPALFLHALAKRVQELGVDLQTDTELLGFEISGRRVMTVKTTRGDFQPQQVVLAAGSWSAELARELRLKLPIQPAKGYSITVQRPKHCPRIPLHLGEARVAVTPMGPRLRFAGTLELAGFDLSINQRRVNAIMRAGGDYLEKESMEELVLEEVWRGLRPCTPDGLPIIGRSAAPDNLVVAAGHATVGMSLGPITGELVAQLACEEEPSIDMSALSMERFG